MTAVLSYGEPSPRGTKAPNGSSAPGVRLPAALPVRALEITQFGGQNGKRSTGWEYTFFFFPISPLSLSLSFFSIFFLNINHNRFHKAP